MTMASSIETASLLTTIRLTLTPYLPPPLIQSARSFDAVAIEWISVDEFSTLLLLTIIFGYITYFITSKFIGRGDTFFDVAKDEDVMALASSTGQAGGNLSWSHTVLLCGPSGGGKTVLFHHLCDTSTHTGKYNRKGGIEGDINGGHSKMSHVLPTVMSLKAAEGGMKVENNKSVRFIDFPGHPSFRPSLSGVALKQADRIILVLDSTKPVTESAAMLYLILTESNLYKAWKKNPQKQIPLLIACAKADIVTAKNAKRIKLQLRSELERMRKVKNQSQENGGAGSRVGDEEEEVIPLGTLGENLDLDSCSDLPCLISFTSLSCVEKGGCEHEGMADVRSFALGTVSKNRAHEKDR